MECDICGQKIHFMSAIRKDGRYICKECRKWFPSVLCMQDYNFSQVCVLIDYEKKHGQNFRCTAHNGMLYLDETAGKIAYSRYGIKNPAVKNNVFCITDLKDISVTLSEPAVIRENIYCDILMNVITEYPVKTAFTRTVRQNVPCVYERVDSSTVKFHDPPEILAVRNMLLKMLSDNVTELKQHE